MWPYVALLLFTIAVVIYQEYWGDLKIGVRNYSLDVLPLLVYLVYVLFFSLRDYIGYDYGMYVNIAAIDNTTGYELRHEYLSAFFLHLAYVYDDYHVFFFLVALIAFAGIVFSLHKYTGIQGSLGWGMLTFLAMPMGITEMLSPQRQFLAMGIYMLSIKYILQGSWWKHVPIVLLASMAHISSLIGLAIYTLRSRRINRKMIIISSMVMMVFVIYMVQLVMMVVPMFAQYMESMEANKSGGEMQLLLYIVLGIISVILGKYISNPNYRILEKLFLSGTCIACILAPFDLKVACRFAQYGIYAIFFMVPMYFTAFGKYKWLVKIITVVILSLLYTYNLLVADANYYMPYKTWL